MPRATLHEQVYDVVWSGDRKPGANGKLPPSATRSTRQCDLDQYHRRTRVDGRLAAIPSFNPQQRAFYYVRVLEIPTPRWTAYDAKRFGVKPLPQIFR